MNENQELVNKSLVRFTVWSSVVWLLIVSLIGLLTSLKFIWPDFLGATYFTSFSPLRVTHVNGVIFGWWMTSAIAVCFYIVPRLTGRRLFLEPLAWATAIGWNIGLALGLASLILGFNQGIELGEFIWPIDVAVALVLASLCVVVIGTVVTRVEPKIFVSLWYIMAAVVWTLLNWSLGVAGPKTKKRQN